MTDEELNALLVRVPLLTSRYMGGYERHVQSLRASAARFAGLAGTLVRRMSGWWSDLDRTEQVWAATTRERPDASRFVPDLSQMHGEASKPRYAFWTSTHVRPHTSPWLEWPEGQFDGPPALWRMKVTDGARIAEIHSPRDWSDLCLRHPAGSAMRLDPDWHHVARAWDAVHLSTGGWLTAEDLPYQVDGGITELRGWNMESTVWLRWCFTGAEPLAGVAAP